MQRGAMVCRFRAEKSNIEILNFTTQPTRRPHRHDHQVLGHGNGAGPGQQQERRDASQRVRDRPSKKVQDWCEETLPYLRSSAA